MKTDDSSTTARAAGKKLRVLLYLISILSDFSTFIIIFTVSRTLADLNYGPLYLGIIGAGLSFCAGITAILGGYLSSRFDGRIVFLIGTSAVVVSGTLCGLLKPGTGWFLPAYWLLGLGLGLLYPPLIGWLNQDEDAHADHAGVNRRLILFCIAWNLGMLMGQLLGGRLLTLGILWTLGAGIGAGGLNFLLSMVAVRFVHPIQPVVISGESVSIERMELANTFKQLGWIANLGGVFGGAMIIHLLPNLMVAIGTPADRHGELLAGWRGVIILTYLVMYGFSFWQYRLSVSIGSQLLGAIGLVVIAVAESNAMLFLGLALHGQLAGFNYYSSLFYSTAGSRQERRALAAGIHEATLATGMAFGTIAGGWLGSVIGKRAPYHMAALFVVVLVIIQLAVRLKRSSRHQPEG